jgi:hypothetical protein
MTHSKYQLQVERTSKYDYTAVVVDFTEEKLETTTIMAKSMAELMAKILVAMVLRDKNVGVAEDAAVCAPINNGGEKKPIIFTPAKRIVTP